MRQTRAHVEDMDDELKAIEQLLRRHKVYDHKIYPKKPVKLDERTFFPSSAGASSAKTNSALRRTDQHVKPVNASASPPSAAEYQESPKTKKRDKSKVNLSLCKHVVNCKQPH